MYYRFLRLVVIVAVVTPALVIHATGPANFKPDGMVTGSTLAGWHVLGDAAFGMVGMDVETAVREQIPILTILLNNSAMGNYEKHIPQASEKYRTKFLSGRYADVARGLGAHAERIEHPGAVAEAIQRGINATRDGHPALLEFITREEPDMAIG